MSSGYKETGYEVVEGWGKLPDGWSFGHVIGCAIDAEDNVYVLNRGEHSMVIYDRDGSVKGSWEVKLPTSHGLHIEGDVAYVADYHRHTVQKFTLDGKLLETWGTEDVVGEEGVPFNRPTDIDVAPSGEVYVSDGYGNSRVHKYSADGELLLSWGEKGTGPSQFDISHDVAIAADGRVLICDRQNHRIQIFTADGEYITEWGGFKQPCSATIDKDGYVYVSELQARFSILDKDGVLVARWGGEPSLEPGQFMNPHCACIDSRGDLYIGETLAGSRIQKFRKI